MENEELTGTKVPHLKVTGTVTKFPWKSNFPIPSFQRINLLNLRKSTVKGRASLNGELRQLGTHPFRSVESVIAGTAATRARRSLGIRSPDASLEVSSEGGEKIGILSG